jgi:hypothetical protein
MHAAPSPRMATPSALLSMPLGPESPSTKTNMFSLKENREREWLSLPSSTCTALCIRTIRWTRAPGLVIHDTSETESRVSLRHG